MDHQNERSRNSPVARRARAGVRRAQQSRRTSTERALRAALAQAEAASVARAEFLSLVSHELRTPINSILGFAELTYRDRQEPLPPRHHERVARILKSGEHLAKLIDDLLDLSRIDAKNLSVVLEAVDVSGVVDEVSASLQAMAAVRGVRIDVGPALTAPPWVIGDRTRLVQVLLNLGSNAVKYNREGGSVTVTISRPTAGTVRVEVRDTGMGIPLEQQRGLFQPFQRAMQERSDIPGTGLGLFLVRRLMELMKGTVGFESSQRIGSTFWIELPLCTPEVQGRAFEPSAHHRRACASATQAPGSGRDARPPLRALSVVGTVK